MLAACGDGEKKSETEGQKATSATETTEKVEQISEEGSDAKKVIPINEAASKSESEDAAETPKPIKKSPKKAPRVLNNDSESLVDIIESPIDDIIVDEPAFSSEKIADQEPNVVENKKSQSADQKQIVTEPTEVQSDQAQVTADNKGLETKVRNNQSDSNNSPIYELDDRSENVSIESPEVSVDSEVEINSEVTDVSEETMEGEFSNAESSANKAVDEEDFIM